MLWVNGKQTKVKFSADTFSFMFLGKILVTYNNPSRKSTFGPDSVKPVSAKITDTNGKTTIVNSGVFGRDIAVKARSGQIRSIEVNLA